MFHPQAIHQSEKPISTQLLHHARLYLKVSKVLQLITLSLQRVQEGGEMLIIGRDNALRGCQEEDDTKGLRLVHDFDEISLDQPVLDGLFPRI